MIIYELKEARAEIRSENKKDIVPGCAFDVDEDPEIIERFESKEDALKALEAYETEVKYFRSYAGIGYYLVTEWYVEENEYDDDEEWIGGGDVWDFSKMPTEDEDEE